MTQVLMTVWESSRKQNKTKKNQIESCVWQIVWDVRNQYKHTLALLNLNWSSVLILICCQSKTISSAFTSACSTVSAWSVRVTNAISSSLRVGKSGTSSQQKWTINSSLIQYHSFLSLSLSPFPFILSFFALLFFSFVFTFEFTFPDCVFRSDSRHVATSFNQNVDLTVLAFFLHHLLRQLLIIVLEMNLEVLPGNKTFFKFVAFSWRRLARRTRLNFSLAFSSSLKTSRIFSIGISSWFRNKWRKTPPGVLRRDPFW